MYRERRSPVPGVVRWSTEPGPARETRVLPDGCMDLILVDDRLLVAGPDTTAQLTPVAADQGFRALRLPPGVAPAALGVPADRLRDSRVALEDLWPVHRARRLRDAALAAADPWSVLESAVSPPDGWIRQVLALLRTGADIDAVARSLDLSPRHLHRRSLAAFGYGPRRLAAILRFQRAVRLGRRSGQPLARIASETGYADQAHLAREVRRFAGVTATALLGRSSQPAGSGA
jgi:AraC-like DNA-binding protein